jgi:hypothetical protein
MRTWTSTGDFTMEVAQGASRDGVVGSTMGKKIGELAVKSLPKPTR